MRYFLTNANRGRDVGLVDNMPNVAIVDIHSIESDNDRDSDDDNESDEEESLVWVFQLCGSIPMLICHRVTDDHDDDDSSGYER